MSQIEQEFRTFLSVRPELTKCYNAGLINRRSLARYLVTHGFSDIDKIEAIVAMLRRFKFEDHDMKDQIIKFKDSRIIVKDGITIINFEK